MRIERVTIIGANGTMGRNIAAIFASFGGAEVYLVSRTLEKSVEARACAYQSVRAKSAQRRMIPADYGQLRECVKRSDLVFEACAEDIIVKEAVHRQVAAVLTELSAQERAHKVICSGTSGLSITKLAELYAEEDRKHVIGMHFFNPPYQMTLCELSPTIYTDRSMFEDILLYVKQTLLRTAVEVKDSPAFLGNRIGFQFINEAMILAERYQDNGGIDYIDAIFGSFSGRAMAPLVTANFVGLDVHKAIMENLHENVRDFAHDSFVVPKYVYDLIEKGMMGRKTKQGLYKTVTYSNGLKIHQVYDIAHGSYREVIRYTFPFVEEMLTHLQVGDYDEAMDVLKSNHSAEAEICLEGLLKYVLYALSATGLVGYDIHAADDVMAAGFNWCPPLAMVQALGGKREFGRLCRERIGYPIYLFDLYVKNPSTPVVFGEESLIGVNTFLSKYFGMDVFVRNVNLEFRYKNGYYLGNVYTFFRRPLHDFGFFGMLIFTALVALLFSWIYYGKIKWKSRTVSTDCWSIVYGYLFYWVVASSIVQYSQTYISLNVLILILIMVVGYHLLNGIVISSSGLKYRKKRTLSRGKIRMNVR